MDLLVVLFGVQGVEYVFVGVMFHRNYLVDKMDSHVPVCMRRASLLLQDWMRPTIHGLHSFSRFLPLPLIHLP